MAALGLCSEGQSRGSPEPSASPRHWRRRCQAGKKKAFKANFVSTGSALRQWESQRQESPHIDLPGWQHLIEAHTNMET